MNYALFTDWTKDRVEELVHVFGVPRADAEELVRYLKNGCIAAEAEARNADQFLLNFKRLKSKGMAKLHGKTEQAMRKKRTKLLNRNQELRSGLREEA